MHNCTLSGRLRRVFEEVPYCQRLLDIGCDRGDTTKHYALKSKEVIGVDSNKEAIEDAKRNHKNIKFVMTKDKLPFKKGYFDVVTATEVLEHVKDEKEFISEIARVIKKEGTLILSVPHKGLFHFVDAFNLKYQFPRLYQLWKGKEYDPDIYKMEGWHRHYSLKQLRKLLDPYFEIIYVHRGGFILFPIIWIFHDMIIHKLIKNKKKWYAFTGKISDSEYQINFGKFGYNLMIKAIRK